MTFSHKLQNKLNELHELEHRPKEMQVSVFGKYNHGKSSLLNALLNHKDEFKVADKRETRQIKSLSKEGILWTDTPGLDADVQQQDDAHANEMYKKSDLILFVHSLKEGEFDKKELEFVQAKYKEKLFFMVLTQMDQVNDDTVFKAIKAQLSRYNLEFFQVSSTRAFHKNQNIRKRSYITPLHDRIVNMKKSVLEARHKQIKALAKNIIKYINANELPNLREQEATLDDKIRQMELKFHTDKLKIQVAKLKSML